MLNINQVFLSIFLFIFSSLVCSSELKKSLEQGMSEFEPLIMEAIYSGQSITKISHSDFWRLFKNKNNASNKDVALLSKALRVQFLLGQEYQKAVWMSAKLSAEAGQITRVKDFEGIQKRTTNPSSFADVVAEEGSIQHYKIVQKSKISMRSARSAARDILETASRKGELDFGDGVLIKLDVIAIDAILLDLELAFSNMEKLVDPEWR